MGGNIQPEKGEVIDMFAWRPKEVELVQGHDAQELAFEYGNEQQALAALLRKIYPNRKIDIDKLF